MQLSDDELRVYLKTIIQQLSDISNLLRRLVEQSEAPAECGPGPAERAEAPTERGPGPAVCWWAVIDKTESDVSLRWLGSELDNVRRWAPKEERSLFSSKKAAELALNVALTYFRSGSENDLRIVKVK